MSAVASFDLTTQPWIPCIRLDGSPVELSLGDALVHAHELREVRDDSPLVTAALHRLLLAVLHRALDGPRDFDAKAALLRAGRFPADKVREYLGDWRQRFDLRHGERPFYQCPHLPHEPAPASKLTHERASGNNATLFDHSTDSSPRPISLAEAARRVVALQGYAVGGTISRLRGEPTSAHHAPLVQGALVLLRSSDVHRTLTLNLLLYDAARHPIPAHEDHPAWEQPHPATLATREPRGWLDLLTWQSRRIALVAGPGDHPAVHHVVVANGVTLDPGPVCDPMMAWRVHPKQGFVPVAFEPDRAVWRDSTALLRTPDGTGEAPRATAEAATLVRRKILRPSDALSFQLLGMGTSRAKLLLWRDERMPVPAALLDDPDAIIQLEDAVQAAESGHKALGAALWQLASLALSPSASQPDGRRPGSEQVRALIESFGAHAAYWNALGVAFMSLPGAIIDEPAGVLDRWATAIRTAAWNAFSTVVDSLGTSSRALHAAARGEVTLAGRLAQLTAHVGEEQS